MNDLNDLVERRAFEILDRLTQFLLFLERKLCICVERPTLLPLAAFVLLEPLFLGGEVRRDH